MTSDLEVPASGGLRSGLSLGSIWGARVRRAPRGSNVYTPRGRFDLGLRRAWDYRALLPYFGWTVVVRRFRNTWLGVLWIPLRPTFQMLSKGLVFGGMLQVGSGNRPYLIFLMVGQAGWDFFDKAVYQSFRPLGSHRRVLEGAPVPWVTAITSTLVPAAVDAAQFAAIGALASVYYRLTEGSFYLDFGLGREFWLAVGAILLALWSVAIALIVAPLIIAARDLRYLIRYGLSFLYFLTPVLYATSSLPPRYRGLAEYNPITAPIELIKDSLLSTGGPSSTTMLVSLIGLAAALPVGLLVSSIYERQAHAEL
jgi:lipopolysaccharide transport system permease protein